MLEPGDRPVVSLPGATHAGRTELAARQDRIQDRIVALRERIADRCIPDEVPAT